jgi:hypothetical protein
VNEHTHDEKDSRTNKNEEINVSQRRAKRKNLTTRNARKGTRQRAECRWFKTECMIWNWF